MSSATVFFATDEGLAVIRDVTANNHKETPLRGASLLVVGDPHPNRGDTVGPMERLKKITEIALELFCEERARQSKRGDT